MLKGIFDDFFDYKSSTFIVLVHRHSRMDSNQMLNQLIILKRYPFEWLRIWNKIKWMI